jgi:hypothetical protein
VADVAVPHHVVLALDPEFTRRVPLEHRAFFSYYEEMSSQQAFPPLRPSASHDASRQAEIARVRRMTVEERIKAALGLASRFATLRPVPRKD